MSAQPVLTSAGLLEDDEFTFSYNAVPGSGPNDPPILLPFGPPSLSALVTLRQAAIQVRLLSEGLPPGSSVFFDKAHPIVWHEFGSSTLIPQPDWIDAFVAESAEITFNVNNPAGTTDPTGLLSPIIVGFTPVVLYKATPGSNPVPISVPDPSIVNVDPTGGSN
jgi:hypothetical protein